MIRFLIVVLLLAGCAHAPPRQPTGLTAASFWKDQTERAKATERISGKLNVRYQMKDKSVSGRGRIVSQPEHVRLELRDPLGRMQYLLTLGGKEMVAYYPSQKLAYLDAQAGVEYLRRFMGLDVSLGDLASLFVGVVPTAKHETSSWAWDPAAGYYKGTAQGATVWVDGVTGALREMELEKSKQTIHVTYSDFSPCCGSAGRLALGNNVSIELRNEKTAVEIDWQDITPFAVPKGNDIFQAELPPDVRKIVLK